MSLQKVSTKEFQKFCREPGNYPKYAFQLWDTYAFPKECEIRARNKDLGNGFVFKFRRYTALGGAITIEDARSLDWGTHATVIAHSARHKDMIAMLFKDFRPVDHWGAPDMSDNHFLIMTAFPNKIGTDWEEEQKKFENASVHFTQCQEDFDKLGVNTDRNEFPADIPTAIVLEEGDNIPIAVARVPNIVTEDEWSFGILRGVYTRPTHHRQGYATLATKRAQAWALDERGLERVHLYVEDTNTAAVMLYRKMGWQITSNIVAAECDPRTDI